jgi:hypothetical protein
MAVRSGRRCSNLLSVLAIGAFAAMAAVAVPQAASAEGLFDFFFGGFQRREAPPPPQVNSYADPYANPAPERPRYGGGGGGAGGIGGRSVAYCVRLCDGQHFPIQHMANATPLEVCKQLCPASKTKIFFGSAIDHAVASDGTHYASLDNAFVYRDKLVGNCTCNGKDAFGLAPLDVNSDPTLRPGDIVSTESGLMAYNGRRGKQTADFTPVNSSTSLTDLAHQRPNARLSRSGAAVTDQPPEQAEQPDQAERVPERSPPARAPYVDLRGQVDR